MISHDLVIDLHHQTVHQADELLQLPHLSFQMLRVLLDSAPDVVSIDGLIQQVWDNRTVSDDTVTQRVALLRKALQRGSADNTRYIQSIRGQGYRWQPPVQQKSSVQTTRRSVLWWITTAAVLLLTTSGLLWFDQQRSGKNQPTIKSLMPTTEYTTQGWQYLDKHESKSVRLAADLFRKALEQQPDDVNALTGLSIALSHQVTKFNQSAVILTEARQLAELAVELNSSHAQAWAALAFVHDANGDIDQAISGYEKAISLDPDNTSTISSLAYLYGVKGRLAEALQLNISVLGSQQLYLHVQLAHVLDLLGFEAVAEIWYQRADELSPDNVFATHQMARFYLSQGRFGDASEVVQAAINRGIRRPELWVVSGIIAWLGQDVPAAEDAFMHAVELDPEDTESQLWLFMLRNDVKSTSPQQWRDFASTWFSVTEQWPDTLVLQALLYARFNQAEQAVTALRLAVKRGYANHQWLRYLPVLHHTSQWPEWLALIEQMQENVGNQRQMVLDAAWLPNDLLDPQRY